MTRFLTFTFVIEYVSPINEHEMQRRSVEIRAKIGQKKLSLWSKL